MKGASASSVSSSEAMIVSPGLVKVLPEICDSMYLGGPLRSSKRGPRMVKYMELRSFFHVHWPLLPGPNVTRISS